MTTKAYAPKPKPAFIHYEPGFVHDVEHQCYTAQQLDEHADATHKLRTRDSDYIQVRAEDLRAMLERVAVAGELPPPSDTLWRLLTGGYSRQYVCQLDNERHEGRVLLDRAISNWQKICAEISAAQGQQEEV